MQQANGPTRGRKAVEGKDYRAFSPVFHVDNKRADPAKVICMEHASPNMGGLVNNPAFNLPLWAKNAGASGAFNNQQRRKHKMKQKKSPRSGRNSRSLKQDQALSADGGEMKQPKPECEAAQAENDAIESKIETAELKARNEALNRQARKRQLEDASLAVRNAVKRGAIAAANCLNNGCGKRALPPIPEEEMLDSIPGNAAGISARQIIGGGRGDNHR